MWLVAYTSSAEQRCGSVRPAAPSALHPAIQSRTWDRKGTCTPLYTVCVCVYMKDEPPYSLTHMWTGGFHVSVWICCRSTVSANGSDMGRQQVIDEDDAVLWHNRFPLCPGWGWGLLFAPPVIAWRIDSEQCAISRTVIKPHYSFFTTPIWVLETQWATLKRRRCLVTVRPLPVLLSPLYFIRSCFALSLPLFWIIRCLPFRTEQPAIRCSFPL